MLSAAGLVLSHKTLHAAHHWRTCRARLDSRLQNSLISNHALYPLKTAFPITKCPSRRESALCTMQRCEGHSKAKDDRAILASAVHGQCHCQAVLKKHSPSSSYSHLELASVFPASLRKCLTTPSRPTTSLNAP